ncbi:hypothetical protein EGR_04849 [Echinococcus granulosus]|uniref:Uncharacterized protein n=1 Tax=Echinococcus granulosus TaxID=6210 RepID=W6UH08_ECHGR|nr:hypothetical protein EGR_04849 [Echinococcus granulosus]EUB60291.1 hypothetical protein EGR_04849 [Echinococcus granulosus]
MSVQVSTRIEDTDTTSKIRFVLWNLQISGARIWFEVSQMWQQMCWRRPRRNSVKINCIYSKFLFSTKNYVCQNPTFYSLVVIYTDYLTQFYGLCNSPPITCAFLHAFVNYLQLQIVLMTLLQKVYPEVRFGNDLQRSTDMESARRDREKCESNCILRLIVCTTASLYLSFLPSGIPWQKKYGFVHYLMS